MCKFRNILLSFFKKNCLNKDILVTLLELVSKTRDFQISKYYNITIFGLKI